MKHRNYYKKCGIRIKMNPETRGDKIIARKRKTKEKWKRLKKRLNITRQKRLKENKIQL